MSFETTVIIDTTAATIREVAADGSRTYTSGDNPTAAVHYYGTGYADTSAAYTAINALLYTETPLEPFVRGTDGKPRFHGLPVTSITVTRRDNVNLYDIVVNCSSPVVTNTAGQNGNPSSEIATNPSYSPPAVEDSQFSYNVGQQSTHVDFGRAVIGRARYDGATPIEFAGIGPQDDGRFTGAEMLVPFVQMTIQRSEPKWFMNMARRVALAGMVGTVNDAIYAGFGAGCVMFSGINTSQKWLEWSDDSGTHRDWYWQTSYVFNVRQASSIVVGGTTLAIRGFDVASFEDGVLAVNETSVFTPSQVSIWSLYPSADFAQIGLVFPT